MNGHEAELVVREYGDDTEYYNVRISCAKVFRDFNVRLHNEEEKIYCPYCGRKLKVSITFGARVEEE